MLNRGAILLRYRAPMVRWINEADPYDDDPGITPETLQKERTVYLISEKDADGDDAVEKWLKLNFRTLFENELEGWYADSDLWPKNRTLKVFREWFEIECHSVIVDTVGGEIFDDEA